MFRRPLLLSFFLSTLTLHTVHGEESFKMSSAKEETCLSSCRSARLTARHIEGNGVGYNRGYTTLEGFVAPNQPWNGDWVPFLDMRGHVFNNGKLASNAGIGLRYLTPLRVWGANAYYDYRNTSHQHYNQVSMGLESLGRILDFRLNGYLPVGDKASSFFRKQFGGFKGHHMFIKRKREVALKGANAEIGAHIDNIKHMPIYLATGPYYLHGKGKTSWGAELRAGIDFFDYVRLEGNSSYDSLFGWIGQGQISLNLPLGRKKVLKLRKNNSCSQERILRCRALQRVDRNEIIPVDNQHKKFVAINPVTHTPFTFWFVDNTSSSDGTFESPFPRLLRAQASSLPNDIIYVFKGDGTSRGMDNGLTLQNNQLLLGSGNKHSLRTTLGKITIPAFTSGMPLVTTSGENVITLAYHNTISGIHIDNGSVSGVFGSSVRDVTLQNNLFTANILQTSVNLVNTSGKIAIKKNVFLTSAIPDSLLPNANGISVANTDVIAALSIRNNVFKNQGGFGTLIVMKGNSNHLIDIRDNTFIAPIGFESEQSLIFPPFFPGTTPVGIGISGLDTSAALVSISNNRCLHHEVAGIFIKTNDNAQIHSAIISNVVHPGILVPIVGSTASTGIGLEMFGDSVQTSLISSNVVTASKSFGIAFANIGTANCSVKIANNSVSGGGQGVGTTFFGGGISAVLENTGNLTAEIANNVLVDNLSTGGVLGMNLAVFSPSDGILCVDLHNNTSNTGYTLYNPNTGPGSPRIQLEEGYQTNRGTINGVSPRSPFIPPAPIPSGSPFPLPGGPISLVPQGFCP